MPAKFSQYEAQFRFRQLAEKLYFLAVLPILLPSLLLVLNGQTRTMIALEVVEQGKLMTFRKLQVYFEFRLSSTSVMFFICCVVALHESQSQALNSNFLRDKLKLQ